MARYHRSTAGWTIVGLMLHYCCCSCGSVGRGAAAVDAFVLRPAPTTRTTTAPATLPTTTTPTLLRTSSPIRTKTTRLHVIDHSHHLLESASNLMISLAQDASSTAVETSSSSSSSAVVDIPATAAGLTQPLDAPPEAGGISYSKTSYYTILGLYVLSFPGLWSTIKRSTKAKIQRKTFVAPGEKSTDSKDGKGLRQEAGEIMAYMKANNYEVVDAGETITFRGLISRSPSQAFFLTFCTALGLLSLALVLQIQFQDLELPLGLGSPNWFLLALLSPYAGIYYWQAAGDRIDEYKVRLETNPEETVNEISVEGSEEEIDRMWRTLNWQEKGMVQVKGLLDA